MHAVGLVRRPSLLFVPVSGPVGTGEYVRSYTIAEGFQAKHPDARIRFVLSRHAPVAKSCPFETVLLDRSPTHETAALTELLERDPPDVTVFDNAGRMAALRAARRAGSRVVWISRRPKLRWKAFRAHCLPLLDEHWIAFPRFLEGDIGPWEQAKLRLFGDVQVRFLGAVFTPTNAARRRTLLERLGLDEDGYALLTPGGGGQRGHGPQAPEIFAHAAERVAERTGVPVVITTGLNASDSPPLGNGVRRVPELAPGELPDLMSSARALALNGGTTLTQALALGKTAVSAPVASDQHRRVRLCGRRGVVIPASLHEGDIAAGLEALLTDDGLRDDMTRRIAEVDVDNGREGAVAALDELLARGRA
ncbi:MAG: hypothetical protein AAF533_01405 [Acidobacteriota bacterium]